MSRDIGREVRENWGLFYANVKSFIIKYCYVIYSVDEGYPLERACNYKNLDEAKKAMIRRLRELQSSGFACSETDELFLGVPVYVCRGFLQTNKPLARGLELVVRLDMEKEPRLGTGWRSNIESIRMILRALRNWNREA